VRLLFQIPYPGYLRIYGSTVAELAERGHHVLLSYDMPDKRRDAPAETIESRPNIELVPPLPAPSRRLEGLVTSLRLTADYSRYLDPRFAEAAYLRRRVEANLSGRLRAVARIPGAVRFHGALTRGLLALERLVPTDDAVAAAIRSHEPDVVLVTPLLARSKREIRQTDTVKAARRLGIPVAAGIASWDHLTTKGLIKALPDRVLVWNEGQRREAVELHGIPPDCVVITGAQLFDEWFARDPSTTREEFLAPLGLDPACPYVLYAGSSRAIAPADKEIPFVRDWLAALRASGDERLSTLGVVIRPHPGNMSEWAEVELDDPRAAVVPTSRPNIPMSESDLALYYDSIHHAAVVVGINTSAIVESFIQRRTVLTVADARFRETQGGTLHFRHLLPESGGAVCHAGDIPTHLGQLRDAVAAPDGRRAEIESFLRTFVRPAGLERPATPIVADAIEQLAALPASRRGTR
jgi:hypothetical protein